VKIHPSDLTLEGLLLSGDGKGPLLRHLAGCPHCRSRLGPAQDRPASKTAFSEGSAGSPGGGILRLSTPASGDAASTVDYGPAIERSERKYLEHARVIHLERAEAPSLLADLLAHPQEKRKLLLANSSRFQTWGLYELLLDRSWESRGASRSQSEELVSLAIHLAPHLDGSFYRRQAIEDLQARAWSYLANLRRIATDLDGAEEAFRIAYTHLKQGTRESFERAIFLDLKASLRGTQRRSEEAKKLLHRAINIFLNQGDEHRAGKSLLSLSHILNHTGKTEEAIAVLQQSLRLLDPAQDERLLLFAWHNLIDYLTNLGRFIEAQGLYRKARPLYRKYNMDCEFGTRRLWLKGRIARGLGQRPEAEALLLAARERFVSEKIPYDAALVSLELAILYAEQERTAELKQLAAEMLPIFTSWNIHREALAALMFLKQAVDAERLTIQAATSIADFLRRAADDPVLTFEAPIPQQ
jgi:tetratricopeptide (TPR) repeat protein